MEILSMTGFIFLAYLIGAIPFGYILVKLKTGEDIRDSHSGRIGGTNAMRAGGYLIGLITGILDTLKSACVVWLAKDIFPGLYWVHIFSPIAAIIGHNYSIFMLGREKDGKLRIGGGAGGATCLGGSFGLWMPGGWIIVLLGILIFWFVGYASVVTMSFALLSTVIFSIRAWMGVSPWVYAVYGLLAEILLVIALRPNIKRLLDGSERIHGYRRRRREKKAQKAGNQ